METITDLPLLRPNLLQSNGLLGQELRDVDQVAMPLDFAVMAHLANQGPRGILDGGKLTTKSTCGNPVHAARGFPSQSLMRALVVVLLDEPIKTALLQVERWLGWDRLLKGSVHPFVASVLAGLARLDALGADAQLDPPFRQLTDAAQRQGGKRRPVIGTNRVGQTILAKGPLKPGPHRLVAGVLQASTDQQIPREIVAQRQRITASSVT